MPSFSYIAMFSGVYLNVFPIGLSSLETGMKVSSPNCYYFKKPYILSQTISHNCAYFKKICLTLLTASWSIKVFLVPWYRPVYTPCFEEVYLDLRNQSACLCVTTFAAFFDLLMSLGQ